MGEDVLRLLQECSSKALKSLKMAQRCPKMVPRWAHHGPRWCKMTVLGCIGLAFVSVLPSFCLCFVFLPLFCLCFVCFAFAFQMGGSLKLFLFCWICFEPILGRFEEAQKRALHKSAPLSHGSPRELGEVHHSHTGAPFPRGLKESATQKCTTLARERP